MIEEGYLKIYYENYFLNDELNWGYLYTMSCIASKEGPELKTAEETCGVPASKENWLAACIRKARNLFITTNISPEQKA